MEIALTPENKPFYDPIIKVAAGIPLTDDELDRLTELVTDYITLRGTAPIGEPPTLHHRYLEGLNETVRRRAERDHDGWTISMVELQNGTIWTPVSGVRTRVVWVVELTNGNGGTLTTSYTLASDDTLQEGSQTIKLRA